MTSIEARIMGYLLGGAGTAELFRHQEREMGLEPLSYPVIRQTATALQAKGWLTISWGAPGPRRRGAHGRFFTLTDRGAKAILSLMHPESSEPLASGR